MNVVDAPAAGLGAGASLWLILGVVLPVLAVTATAFAKVSVVLGALRVGLGLPEVLPLPVLSGLAAVLAAVIMLPTAQHTRAEDLGTVVAATTRLDPSKAAPTPPDRVLAFLLSELAAAFQLALAVLLPFLIIDLLTANTLAVLGWGLLVRGLVASDG